MVRDCEQRIDVATAVDERIYHSEHKEQYVNWSESVIMIDDAR